MNKGKFLRLLSITLAFAFLFSVSCQDLKYSKLKANYFFKKANAKFTEEDYKVAAEEYTRVLKIDPPISPPTITSPPATSSSTRWVSPWMTNW